MNKRLGIFIGIGILALGVATLFLMKNSKGEAQETAQVPGPTMVQVEPVILKALPYIVEATGTLRAKEKIELFSEVQGTLKKTAVPFKEGNYFRRGQTLIHIDSQEFLAQIKSNKSSLVNQIAAMLPDMEMEYPEASKKWATYLTEFDMEASLVPLPEPQSEAERLFVIGKNITQTYYNVANQEERLTKYYLRAPFNGIVSETNVNVGALVRSGQKLGEFIDPSVFELELSVPATENEFLAKGEKVQLTTVNNQRQYVGIITRINPVIDQETQSVKIYLTVRNKDLRDGQYLKANITGSSVDDVFNISSELLTANETVYVVKDSVLALHPVELINYQGDSVLVRGLKNGQLLVKNTIANAYPGMKVTIED